MNSPAAVRDFSKQSFNSRRCQRCSIQVTQKARAPRSARFLSRSILDINLNASFTLIILPIIIRLSFTQQLILIVVLWGKPAGPRIMRKLWSSLKPKHARIFVKNNRITRANRLPKRKRTKDIPRERGIEAQLRAAAQRANRDQEDATDPMVAPQDCDVHQSVRVLELQSSDLWLRPRDLSWHFPILMTIREIGNRRKVDGQRRTRPKSSRSRRCRKTMMDRFMPTGRHHLGHVTNQRPGHPPLGDAGDRTKRTGVLTGSHHLIGTARIKRVSVPNGDHRAPGTHRSHGSEE